MQPNKIQFLAETNYHELKEKFLTELTNASLGKPSSISYFKHKLPKKALITHGIVQGIVIGGTNYVFQTVRIDDAKQQTRLENKTGTLPIFATKDDLVNFFKEHLDDRAEAIGVNFGFPLEPLYGVFGEVDGKLSHGSKEHTFTGLTEPIGSIIRELMNKRIPVSVANDTVCLTVCDDGSENGSLIAGTGINAGIKIKEHNQTIIVNLEIGNFHAFEQSAVLKKIDHLSEKPGEQLFEKTISGKYLAQYFNQKAKELGIPTHELQTSQELSELSLSDEQNDQIELARAILQRSAFLLATAIAGIYEFCGKPDNFVLIGEGSMLWHGWRYKENVYKKLSQLGIEESALEIKKVEDSSIRGAIGLLTS